MRTLKHYLLLLFGLMLFGKNSYAAVETLNTGSYIINMGVVPQTVTNGLKPYGLIYDLLKNYQIPVKWVIGQSKAKDGVDFTYGGTMYRGGTFIIPSEYMNPTVMGRISFFGVTGSLTTSQLTVDVTYTLNTAPKWTLDLQNGKIAEKFLQAAGIPPTAYTFKYPSQLSVCDDIFVIPHADPTWVKHGNLLNFVTTNKGAVWAGCKSGSSLENLFNPSNTSQQLNFLANNVGSPGHALVPNNVHDKGTPPYVHQLPSNPASQYMGVTDDEHTSGAEQIYMPVAGGSWRSTTDIIAFDPTQQDVPSLSPGPAAVIVYGRAYGNSNNGFVMYEAGHNVGGTSTTAVAAQRAFFNFSFRAMTDKTPVISGVSGATIISQGNNTYSVSATSPVGANLTYQWTSNCGGTFSNPTGSTTMFTPPTVTSPTSCVIKVVVSDPCRQAFATKTITVTPMPSNPVAVNDSKSVPCGVDSVNLNVLTNDSDPNSYPITFSSFTPSNGVTTGGAFFHRGNGNVTFIPNAGFSGTQSISYTISNGTLTASAMITVSIGGSTSAPNAVDDTLMTTRNAARPRFDVKANDSNVGGTNDLIVRITTPATKGSTSVNTDGTVAYIPYMNATGADSFTYQVRNTGGFTSSAKVRITISAGACGPNTVQNSGTVPVPTTVTVAPSDDTYLDQYQGKVDDNFGASSELLVNGEANKANRTLLKFNLPSLPAGATITGASLQLVKVSGDNTPESIAVHKLTQSWVEGTGSGNTGAPSWNKYAPATAWTTPGGDYNTTAEATTAVGNNGTYSWSIVNAVSGWYANPSTNYGLLLKFPVEGNNSEKKFGSKENSNTAVRPMLVVTYTVPSSSGTLSLSSTEDQYLSQYRSVRNYGTCPTIAVDGENTKALRGVLKFDLSVLPAGVTIDSARLVMVATSVQNNDPYAVNVHRMTSAWTEGSECDNDGSPNWNSLSSAFSSTVSATTSVTGTGTYSWDVKNLVDGWVNGSSANNGMMLKFGTENTGNEEKYFASRENPTASMRPMLLISYNATTCAAVPVRPPLANPDFATTSAGVPVNVNAAANDTDFSAGTRVYSIVSAPTNGTASMNSSTGVVNYTSTGTFNGTAVMSYRLLNSTTGLSDTANVYVTVNNGPIDAINDTAPADSSDIVQVINVKGNDIDPDATGPLGNTYAVTIFTAPKNGTATVNSNGSIVYTPATKFSGRDTLIYRICEPTPASGCGTASCDTARVFITVLNRKPTPKNDTTTTTPCTAKTINVLTNDTDPENHMLVVNSPLVTVPASAGTSVNNNDGTITFTPAAGYSGTTIIKYTVTDNGEPTPRTSDTALVVINTVIGANHKPVAVNDFADTVAMDLVVDIDPLENDSDPDGNPLSDPQIITAPLHGTAVVLPNGLVEYQPNPGYVGPDSLVYRISDIVKSITCAPLTGLYDTATIYFFYKTPNSVFAVNDENSTLVNTVVSGNVLTNDFDLEGDSIQFSGFLAFNGTAVNSGNITVSGTDANGASVANAGILAISPNGTYFYTPAINFTGIMNVRYAIQDNRVDQAYDTATLTITVTPKQKNANSIIANNDENFTYGNPVSGNVKDNDRDPQGHAFNVTTYRFDSNSDGVMDSTATLGSPITVSGITGSGRPAPNAGILTLNSNGTYSYTPAVDFSGVVDVVYTICDVVTPPACQSAHLYITVFPNINGPQNDPPFAGDDFVTTSIGVPVTGTFISNDTDPNNDPLSMNGITIVPGGPQNALGTPVATTKGGTVQYYTNGTFQYTPPASYTGPDFVNYTICDVTTVNPQPLCARAMIHMLVDSQAAICVKIRAYLEGALMDNGNAVASDGRPLMRDNLRNSPFTNANYIPSSDPYTFPTQFVDVTGMYTKLAPQSTRPDFQQVQSSAVFAVTGQNAIVDWVFVELRSKSNSSVVLATRSGLVQRDGDVVDVDGVSCLSFPGVATDSYYVALRHRSHLGAMTKFAQSASQLNSLVDMTSTSTPLFDKGVVGPVSYIGLATNNFVVNGYRALWQGDFDANRKVKFSAPNDDNNILLGEVQDYPTNTSLTTGFDFAFGYFQGDYNMNSKAKFAAPNDDQNLLLGQILGYPINAALTTGFDFMVEQLP